MSRRNLFSGSAVWRIVGQSAILNAFRALGIGLEGRLSQMAAGSWVLAGETGNEWRLGYTGTAVGALGRWVQALGERLRGALGGSFILDRLSVAGLLPWLLLAEPFLPTTLNVLLIWGIAGIALGRRLVRGRSLPEIPLGMPLGILAGVLVISATGSIDPHGSLLDLVLWLSYLLLFVLVAVDIRSRRTLLRYAYLLLAGGGLVSLPGLYQLVRGVKTSATWVDLAHNPGLTTRIYSVFSDPNFYAMYLTLLLPLAAALLFRGGRRRRLPVAVTGLLLVASLVYTFSRGGWVAATVALAVWVALVAPRFLCLAPLAALSIPFLPGTVRHRLASFTNLAGSHMLHYRLLIWQGVLPLIQRYPLTGLGLGAGSFVLAYPNTMLAGIPAYHAHNLYLETLLETGLPGLAAFAYFFLSFYRLGLRGWAAVLRLGDPLTVGIAAAAVAAVSGNLFHGLEEDVWYDPHINFILWAVLGLGVAALRLLGGAGGAANAEVVGALDRNATD